MHLTKIKRKVIDRKYIYMLKYKNGKYFKIYPTPNALLTDNRNLAIKFKTLEELNSYMITNGLGKRGIRICKIDITFGTPFNKQNRINQILYNV